MPFGIKTAPSAFQRIIDKVLRNCVGALVYIDDVLVVSKNREELILRSEAVKKRLNEAGLGLNLEKSVEAVWEVEWLGYHLSGSGINQPPEMSRRFERYDRLLF